MRGRKLKRKGALNIRKKDLDGNQGSRNKSATALIKDGAQTNGRNSVPPTTNIG